MPSPAQIGVDVAKDVLQIAFADGPQPVVANQTKAINTWLAKLPPESQIAMEATGRYHQRLAELAHARGMLVYILNPRDLRHYAHAVGTRGKTDRVDARLIARYLVHEQAHLRPYQPPTPAQREIDQLLRRRAEVVRAKTQLRASLQEVAICSSELRSVVRRLEAMIAKLERRIGELAKGQAMAQERVQSVVGIGPLAGVALTNLFERVPLRNANAAVAFIGFDPRPKDSGQSTGRRRLSKRGPAELRRLLFNGARSASKTKLWQPRYEQLRARGLSTTEATVILARQLIRVAFSIHRYQSTFDPERFALLDANHRISG
jgi:transposase